MEKGTWHLFPRGLNAFERVKEGDGLTNANFHFPLQG